EFEQWFEEFGEAEEVPGLDGEGVEEEGGESTEETRRRNLIPPVLPVDVPEELRELPPLLETPQLQALRATSLPEIQERLDEFLALNDPARWALASETDEEVQPVALEEMIAEATAALQLWETQRKLSDRFGAFFIRAEVENLPPSRQAEVLLRAMGRYTHDKELYEGSDDIADLRKRVATRLVTHCRAGSQEGDLVLTACTDETALTVLLVAALQDADLDVPPGSQLGVQAYPDRFEAVLYASEEDEVYSLTRGEPRQGVVAAIYHPAVFYYSYLLSHGVVPEIDVDQHLLIALPNRALPPEEVEKRCVEKKSGNVLGRAIEWLGSMIGVRR